MEEIFPRTDSEWEKLLEVLVELPIREKSVMLKALYIYRPKFQAEIYPYILETDLGKKLIEQLASYLKSKKQKQIHEEFLEDWKKVEELLSSGKVKEFLESCRIKKT